MPKVVHASDIKVTSPTLMNGKTGQKLLLILSGADTHDLADHLTCEVDGPSHIDVVVDYELDDGSTEASFVALDPGDYKITLLFKGHEISGSPVKVKITGNPIYANKLIKDVKVRGKASEIGRALIMNEFVVDTTCIKESLGALKVHIKGPPHTAAHVFVDDCKNGLYKVSYKANDPGVYNLDIKIADEHIPGSPLKIRVLTDFHRNSLC